MSRGEGEMKKHTEVVQSKIRSSININSYHRCVEELILNSLDSSASCIAVRVNVKSGFVLVVDNGSGISYKSMELVGERYASSKCLPLLKKRRSTSHGYRGEALASIAFLCERMEITSKCDEEYETLCKTFHNGQWSLDIGVEARPSRGTTVSVSKLFHSSQHQQSSKSTTQLMSDVLSKVQNLAIIHSSQATFTLKDQRNGKLLVNTARAKSIQESIATVFGTDYCHKLRPVSGTHDQLQVDGVISAQAYPSHKIHLISLNKRILKPNKLHQVVERELRNSLINVPNQQPSRYQGGKRMISQPRNFLFVLNLRCDSKLLDIMIDPDKAKVEFEAWDQMMDSLTKLVRQFLFVNNLNKGAGNINAQEMGIDPPMALAASSTGSSKHADSVILCLSDQELADVLPQRARVKRDNKDSLRKSNVEVKKRKCQPAETLPLGNSSNKSLQPLTMVAHSGLDTPLPSPIGPPGGIHQFPHSEFGTDHYVSQWILLHFSQAEASVYGCSDEEWSLKGLARCSSDEEDIFTEPSHLQSAAIHSPSKVLQSLHSPVVCSDGQSSESAILYTSRGDDLSTRQPFNDVSNRMLLDSGEIKRSLSPVPGYRPSKGLSWSAPQPHTSSLRHHLTSNKRTHQPPTNQHRLKSDYCQDIPHYVTPVRHGNLCELVSRQSGFWSPSSDWNGIFDFFN